MIFLAPGVSSRIYVSTSCPVDCQSEANVQNFSIGSLNITSLIPIIFIIGNNGTETNASAVGFTPGTVLQLAGTSETVLYSLNASANDSGYYSFVFPFTCSLQPVMDIGTHARILNYTLLGNWLGKTGGYSEVCARSMLDVNILGFTNTNYNRVSIGFNST